MKLEEIETILKNSALMEVIPSDVSAISKDLLIRGYSKLIYSIIVMDSDSKEKSILNKIYFKNQANVLDESYLVVLNKVVSAFRGKLSGDTYISLSVDLELLMNNIAIEGVLPYALYLEPDVFTVLRKHIYGATKTTLSAVELSEYKRFLYSVYNWINDKPYQLRHAINVIRSTSKMVNVTISNDELSNYIIDTVLLNIVDDARMVTLLKYPTFWRHVPDEVMHVRSRRKLGRYVSRQMNSIIQNEFKINRKEK